MSPPIEKEVLIDTYRYTDETGHELFQILRFEKGEGERRQKRLKVRHHQPGRGWVWEIRGEPVPYNLPAVVSCGADKRVWIVEGEKCANCLIKCGEVATTNPFGQGPGKWKESWSAWFAGKRIGLIPDNDQVGKDHMERIYQLLKPVALEIVVVEIPGLQPKEDVFDWFDKYGFTVEELDNLYDRALEESRSGSGGVTAAAIPADTDEDDGVTFNWQPFPLDALPAEVADYARWGSEVLSCDPTYILLHQLATLSACIGAKRLLWVNPEWQVPPLLWCCLVAESGTVKTPAWKMGTRPIMDLQIDFLKEYKKAEEAWRLSMQEMEGCKKKRGDGEAWMEDVKDSRPKMKRCVVDNITLEKLVMLNSENPKGLLLSMDELAGWFGSFEKYRDGKGGASDVPQWLQVYNCNPIIKDRKGGEVTTVMLARSFVAVTGSCQPRIIRASLTDAHFHSGLVARLIFAMPPRRKKKFSRSGIPPEVKEAYHKICKRLYSLECDQDADGQLTPLDVHFDEDGMRAWERYYEEWAEEQHLAEGSLAAVLAKLEETAGRLALIFALVDHAAGRSLECSVTAEHVTRGVQVMKWFRHEAERLYLYFKADKDNATEEEILTFIRGRDQRDCKITPRELLRSNARRWTDCKTARAFLDMLVQKGKGEWVRVEAGPQGGRPSDIFQAKRG